MIRFKLILILSLLLFSAAIAAEDETVVSSSEKSLIDEFYNSEAGKQFLNEMISRAKQGDPRSQYELGDQYWLGWGVQQDHSEAVKWYTKAAEQGLLGALNSLGRIYAIGDCVSQDIEKAIQWYSLAAEQGDAEAQFSLSVHLAQNSKNALDFIQAYKWMLLAELNGCNVADSKSQLQSQMTAEQLSEAQDLAKVFTPRITSSRMNQKRNDLETLNNTALTSASGHESRDEDESAASSQFPIRETKDGRRKYVSQTHNFSIYFPTPPKRKVIKDAADSRIIRYQSMAEDGLVQYNLFFHELKTKILDDQLQKAYFQSYLVGRKTYSLRDRLLKRELTFQGSNAVAFKHIIYFGGTHTAHKGLNFFVDGDSIVLTCVYPDSHTPSLSFEDYAKTFEFNIQSISIE